jgi:pimeloyl-ACP methyl ester carboxylesterase
VVALGHSAGGHLALWLGARHRLAPQSALRSADPLPLRGAIALGGVVDLHLAYELGLSDNVVVEFLGGLPDTVPERYHDASPAELLPLGTRQVLIHGHDDEPVPLVVAEHYAGRAHAAGDDVALHALPATGHFEIVDPRSSQWALVEQAVLALQT